VTNPVDRLISISDTTTYPLSSWCRIGSPTSVTLTSTREAHGDSPGQSGQVAPGEFAELEYVPLRSWVGTAGADRLPPAW
jgi:hypothetical protein